MSDMQVVTSRDNPYAKRLDLLIRQKKARKESGLFVLEGVRLCLDAMSAGLRPQSVALTQRVLQKNSELADFVRVAPQTVWLAEQLAERLGETKTPQGVFAIFEAPVSPTVELSPTGRYLLLHQVREPGNLGCILRTAAALGASAVFLNECAELYAPKTLRAGMGGIFRLPVVEVSNMHQQICALRRAGVEVFAAALHRDALPPACLAGPGGRAVVIGNEATGLPEQLITACDAALAIPMQGGSESLNAAVAAGILLWEMLGDENDD